MAESEKKTQISVRFTPDQLKGIEDYQQSRILYCERELVDIALNHDKLISIDKKMGLNPEHKAFFEVLSIPMFFATGLAGLLLALNPELDLVRLMLLSMSIGLIFIGVAFFDHYRIILSAYYGTGKL